MLMKKNNKESAYVEEIILDKNFQSDEKREQRKILREIYPTDVFETFSGLTYMHPSKGNITERRLLVVLDREHTFFQEDLTRSLLYLILGMNPYLIMHFIPLPNAEKLNEIRRKMAQLQADMADTTNVAKQAILQQKIHELKEQYERLSANAETVFESFIELAFRIRPSFPTIAEELDQLDSLQIRIEHILKSLNLQGVFRHGDLAKDFFESYIAYPTSPTERIFSLPPDAKMSLEGRNIADLWPTYTSSLHGTGIIIGSSVTTGEPILWNPWWEALEAQHVVILGQTGSGKSFGSKLLFLRSTLWGVDNAVIDPKGEYDDIAEVLDFPLIRIGADSAHGINPFDVDVEVVAGKTQTNIGSVLDFAGNLIERMIRMYKKEPLRAETKIYLQRKLNELYSRFRITDDPDSLFEPLRPREYQRRKKKMPLLSDYVSLLYQDLQGEIGSRKKKQDDSVLSKDVLYEIVEVYKILYMFTQEAVERKYSKPSLAMFDRHTNPDDLPEHPIVFFSLSGLDDSMKNIGMFVLTTWLTEVWAKRRYFQPKRIWLEEAQILLEDPLTASWIANSYKILRSFNTGLVAISQGVESFLSVSDPKTKQAGLAILKNASTRFFGIQKDVDIELNRRERVFAFTEQEERFILQAKKGEFLVHSGDKKAFVYFEASEDEKFLFESNPETKAFKERKEYLRKKRERKE
ncbi:MAG: DUF87 domain-containing protein [Brockia lithotrophica]|nr:DUF87 domain-containing protein [Brockia lithotrophica]